MPSTLSVIFYVIILAKSFHRSSSFQFTSSSQHRSAQCIFFRFSEEASTTGFMSTGDGDIGKLESLSSTLFLEGPPPETKPDYDNIHGPLGPLMDKVFLVIFRTKMAEKVGIDSNLPKDDYQGLIELTAAMNARFSDRKQVQKLAQDVLRSLFPSWLPRSFGRMFAKPFPEFSSRLNAWATLMAGTWLMGECELNDCDVDDGGTGFNQGLLVKRCRFLEESSCASVCVNSCKIPTQKFFNENMGLPLTMTPDYETGECQFSFGLSPNAVEELEAKNTPCLSRCPSSGGMRKWHSNRKQYRMNTSSPNFGDIEIGTSRCALMDEDGIKCNISENKC